jgi:hypothetical protein
MAQEQDLDEDSGVLVWGAQSAVVNSVGANSQTRAPTPEIIT